MNEESIKCPVCGEICERIYRSERYGDILGCDKCVSELNAESDADVNPGDYGLPDEDEEKEAWRERYKAETRRLREYICSQLQKAST